MNPTEASGAPSRSTNTPKFSIPLTAPATTSPGRSDRRKSLRALEGSGYVTAQALFRPSEYLNPPAFAEKAGNGGYIKHATVIRKVCDEGTECPEPVQDVSDPRRRRPTGRLTVLTPSRDARGRPPHPTSTLATGAGNPRAGHALGDRAGQRPVLLPEVALDAMRACKRSSSPDRPLLERVQARHRGGKGYPSRLAYSGDPPQISAVRRGSSATS